MSIFKHKAAIQIRFKDTDAMGHVNNANFFTYIETARIHYFNEVLGPRLEWRKQDGVILARVELDYRQPILFEDKIGTKSLDLSYAIARDNASLDDKRNIFAEGISVLVGFDYTTQKSVELPKDRVKLIEDYEGVPLR